jgi:Virulence factor BrkB
LFSWYAENFGSYNKTYGSLGAIIGFMVWISTIVVLIGAELHAEMEHQTIPGHDHRRRGHGRGCLGVIRRCETGSLLSMTIGAKMRHEGEWSLTPPRFKEGPVLLG